MTARGWPDRSPPISFWDVTHGLIKFTTGKSAARLAFDQVVNEAEDTATGDHEGQAANDRDLARCGLTRTLHPRKGGSAMAKKAAKKTAKKAAKKR